MTQTATIAYGRGYAREAAELLGTPLGSRIVEVGIYGSPKFTVYAIDDGRVVRAVHGAMYDRLTIYPSLKAYWIAKRAGSQGAIDPETGWLGR